MYEALLLEFAFDAGGELWYTETRQSPSFIPSRSQGRFFCLRCHAQFADWRGGETRARAEAQMLITAGAGRAVAGGPEPRAAPGAGSVATPLCQPVS